LTEIVSLRVKATGVTTKPRMKRALSSKRKSAKPLSLAKGYLGERPSQIPIYAREDLSAGMRLDGPAIITEYSSTTLIPSEWAVEVDPWLNLIIESSGQ
jgi:N-methylhydantoinase A